MKKLLLLVLVLSFSSFANYPTIQSGGGGIGEWEVSAAYTADTIVFDGTDFYKALVDHTSGTTNIADEVLAGTMVKMVDPNDYLVGLTSNVQAQFDAAVARISNNETDIATNQTNITNNTSNIATNQTNIAANSAATATNATNIATNQTNISANATNIATNTTDIATNMADILTINNSIAQPNGLATLDANGKIPLTQFGTELLIYQGAWDGTANSPALSNTDTNVENFWYRVNVAGSIDFGAGPINFNVNDRVVNNGTVWEKWDSTDEVTSVNSQTGDVSLDNFDIGLGNVLDVQQLVVTASDWETNYTEKVSPIIDDIVLIEDSEDSFNKKKVKLQNLLGGGNGDLAAFYVEDYEQFSLADISATGNNATYLTAGTFGGVITLDESVILAGDISLRYTAGAASGNDWINLQTIPLRKREQEQKKLVVSVLVDASSFNNGFDLIVYDETNSTILKTTTIDAGSDAKEYPIVFDIADTTASINIGLHFNQGAVDTEFVVVDNVTATTDLFISQDINEINNFTAFVQGSVAPSLVSKENSNWLDGDCTRNSTGNWDCPLDTTVFNDLPNCQAESKNNGGGDGQFATVCRVIDSLSSPTNLRVICFSEGTASFANAPRNYDFNLTCQKSTDFSQVKSNFVLPSQSNIFDLKNGGSISIEGLATNPVKGTTIRDEVTYARSGQFLIAYYTYEQIAAGTAGSGNYLISLPAGLEIDDSVIDFNTNTFSTGSANVRASSIGMLDSSIHLNRGTVGMVNALKAVAFDANRFRIVGGFQDGNSTLVWGSSGINLSNPTVGLSGWIKIPIKGWTSKNFFYSLIPPLEIAYLRDVKPQGVSGGTTVGGSYVVRDLNVIEGDTNIVSLASNQFTLQKGKYEIEATAPYYVVNGSRIKIFNVTDSTDAIFGNNGTFGGGSNQSDGPANLNGTIEIKETKTFDLRQYTTTTRAGDGLGTPNNIAGESEYYAQIKITKLK